MFWRSLGVSALSLATSGMAARTAAAAPGPAGPVEISRPWAAPAALGADTSVMFQMQNSGTVRDDLILAAWKSSGDSFQLHFGIDPEKAIQMLSDT